MLLEILLSYYNYHWMVIKTTVVTYLLSSSSHSIRPRNLTRITNRIGYLPPNERPDEEVPDTLEMISNSFDVQVVCIQSALTPSTLHRSICNSNFTVKLVLFLLLLHMRGGNYDELQKR